MLYPVVWIVTAAATVALTARIASQIAANGPLLRRNHRGLEVATAAGVAPLFAWVAAMSFPALIRALRPDDALLARDVGVMLTGIFVAVAFGALGLWDDVNPTTGERGWRAHISAIRHARMTSGALKLLAGAGLSLVVAASVPGEQSGFMWVLIRAATLALAANAFNLLDLRPGRAGKFFVVAAVPFIILAQDLRAEFFVAACAMLAVLPGDLRERVMLGDCGANAFGALIGLGIIRAGSSVAVLVSFAVLALVNLAGDRPGLSRIIERVPPLRRFDQAGRARV
ncbi:MAG TPA: hypothetical protein VM600_01010 [Actinomycetota bacterium]|nr:hypothetical protein [Actinomycetota bacterium]